MKDEVSCDYFYSIDPDFPEQAKEVIDDHLYKSALERDWVLDDRSARLWSREEDMHMDAECREEVDMLRKLLAVAVAAIAILLTFLHVVVKGSWALNDTFPIFWGWRSLFLTRVICLG